MIFRANKGLCIDSILTYLNRHEPIAVNEDLYKRAENLLRCGNYLSVVDYQSRIGGYIHYVRVVIVQWPYLDMGIYGIVKIDGVVVDVKELDYTKRKG